MKKILVIDDNMVVRNTNEPKLAALALAASLRATVQVRNTLAEGRR